MSSRLSRPLWTHNHFSKRKRRSLAQPPGMLVHRGLRKVDATKIRVVRYGESFYEENIVSSVPDEGWESEKEGVTWIHFAGLHEVDEIAKVGRLFDIPALMLEDILHTSSRTKIENRESNVFIVTWIIHLDENDNSVKVQHFSLLLLPGNRVITFSEAPMPIFDPVLERISAESGNRIRHLGADYLCWALLDAIVDNYLHVIDHFDEAIVKMDDLLQTEGTEVEVAEIFALNRDINHLYRAVRPIREITGSLSRESSGLLTESSHLFFIDLNDHSIQSVETIEFLREGSNSIRELYLSLASHRMNEVMKVLTCFSTIFLPLTFIAGIYGMNFENMPELSVPWAYPAVWGVFILCASGMFYLFRRMKWL